MFGWRAVGPGGLTMAEQPAIELRIDRIACDGYGLCAELLPELIELDDWGYPIVGRAAVPGELLGHARRAVDACPVLALRLAARPAVQPAAQRAPARSERVRSTAGG
jgi:ferredoxin